MASAIYKNCPECGAEVSQKGRGRARVFCSEAHKTAHANRMTVRGKTLVKVALGWRQTRGSGNLGKFLFSEMTAMLDAWNAEDRAANRMRADEYASSLSDYGICGGSTFVERLSPAVECFERHQGCHRSINCGPGGSPVLAAKWARKEGWLVEIPSGGYNVSYAACPNCRDDNRIGESK